MKFVIKKKYFKAFVVSNSFVSDGNRFGFNNICIWLARTCNIFNDSYPAMTMNGMQDSEL